MLRDQIIKVYGSFAPYTEKTFATFRIQREHSFQGTEDGWYVAKSHCLLCPVCGFKWATLQFPDEPTTWPIGQTCETCTLEDNEWTPVPGSLLAEEGFGVIDYELLRALPDVLLRREFDLHMKAYDNG